MCSIKLVIFVAFALAALSTGKAATTNIDDLIAVVQVFRHGQRAPVSFYPNDPNYNLSLWEVTTGQLTNQGKRQHYELGQFTRKRYDGFLAQTYSNDDFYVQTTDVDRTHMSAQSNVAGIFPVTPEDNWNPDILWQPIPIHPSDESIINGSPDCDIYSTELANVLVNAPEFAAYNEEYADLYAYLTENSGSNVTTVTGAYGIYDTLMIEDQIGYTLPEWTKTVYPEPLRTITGQAFPAFTYTDEMKRLAAGNWLYAVAEYLEEMYEDSTSSARYQIYSAHDMNIAAILNTLGAFRPHYPAFASTLYFELRNKSGNAVVNVWHRNDGVFEPVIVRGCDFDCTLDNFKTVLSPWLVDTDTWITECAANETSTTSVTIIQESTHVQQAHAHVTTILNNERPANKPLSITTTARK